MIEVMFYFFILIAAGILVLGLGLRSPAFVALAAVPFILIGAILMSGEPVVSSQLEQDAYIISEISSTVDDVDANFMQLTVSNDNLVNIFSMLFFYGGFALIPLSFLFYYWQVTGGEEVEV